MTSNFENYVSMRILKNLPDFSEQEVKTNFESDFRNYLQFHDEQKPKILIECAEFERKLNDIADKFYEDYVIDTKKSKETSSSDQ